MPIRPENRARYPKDWKLRSRFVRFYRARNRCEWCGCANHEAHPVTGSRVVLTVAHVFDERPEASSLLNLAALCQRCHNRHDAAGRLQRRREREERASGQMQFNVPDQFSAVYAVLMAHLDAPIGSMQNFIWAHTSERACDEYRFQGRLGFGGKYRRRTNTVDCYPEDETLGRLKLIEETNAALAKISPDPANPNYDACRRSGKGPVGAVGSGDPLNAPHQPRALET